MSENLKQRLFVGSLFLIIAILAIQFSHHLLGKIFFILALSGMILSALNEFYQLCKPFGKPLSWLGILAGLGYLAGIAVNSLIPQNWHLPEIVNLLFLMGGFLYYCFFGKSPLVSLALTFFGVLYIVLPLSRLIPINYIFAGGSFWLLYLILTTKMTDVGAYLAGKSFGKNRLAPYISPNKTWEGSVGGFLAATLTSVLLYYAYNLGTEPLISLNLFQSLWLGALIGILAQFGDLAESLLKRDSGIKDSSHIPGLGGILDLLDSLIFTAPTLYLLLVTKIL